MVTPVPVAAHVSALWLCVFCVHSKPPSMSKPPGAVRSCSRVRVLHLQHDFLF